MGLWPTTFCIRFLKEVPECADTQRVRGNCYYQRIESMAALAKRLATVMLTTVVAFGLAVPAASAGSYENEALALLNEARVAAGLDPVAMDPDLVDDALAWSQHMQAEQQLSHNPNLAAVSDDWARLGENVGVGTSIAALQQAFMDSPGHRANILGDYDHVGIAVVAETSSKLWITVVFMKSLEAAPAAGDDPEPYSELQPPASTGEPVANSATEPAPRASVTSPSPKAVTPAAPFEPVYSVSTYGPVAA